MTQKTVSDMWGRLLDLLVGPMVVVGPASDRRLGRLIATMALALIAAQMVPVVLWIISPMEYVAAVEIATLSVCLPATLLVYLLARRGAPASRPGS